MKPLLILSLFLFPGLLFSAGSHDDHEGPGGRSKVGRTPGMSGKCKVSPRSLANSANGDAGEFSHVVTFITSADCVDPGPGIAMQAIGEGVKFNNRPPFELESYATKLTSGQNGADEINERLAKAVPGLLQANPLTSREMTPLIAQLSLLSPSAARKTLAKKIEAELITGDQRLGLGDYGKTVDSKSLVGLAQGINDLGAGEPAVASEIASDVEDWAVRAQSDSLASLFRALGAASQVENGIAPTFNLTASALNRGVQKGKPYYQPGDVDSVLKAVFAAARSGVLGSEALEGGAAEMNEALSTLIGGKTLQETSIRKFWREVVKMLGQSVNQTSLAAALSSSLTPDLIFLPPRDTHSMMLAATNYPDVSLALQAQSLEAWRGMLADRKAGKVAMKQFGEARAKHMEPLVNEVISFGVEWINPSWLRQVYLWELVSNEQIEKRFPRLVLNYLDKREKAMSRNLASDSVDPLRDALQDLALTWSLSSVHMPILREWMKKQEKE